MSTQTEVNLDRLKELFDDLFTLLEALETQSMATQQFLKEQGITIDEKFAPYLERAGNASNVKWRAARRRMEFLLTPIQKEAPDEGKEKLAEKQQAAKDGSENGEANKPAADTNKVTTPSENTKQPEQESKDKTDTTKKEGKDPQKDTPKHETAKAAGGKPAV